MQRRCWEAKRAGLIAAAFGITLLALVGCSSSGTKAPSASAVAAELSQQQSRVAVATGTPTPSPTPAATTTQPPSGTALPTATKLASAEPTGTPLPQPSPAVAVQPSPVPPTPTKGVAAGPVPAISGSPTRSNQGGSVTLQVTWEEPRAGDSLTFSVAMDTHSVNLDGYDLGRLSTLRNDRGLELKPERWEAPPGGHHRSGTVTFPAADGTGRSILEPGVKVVELVIRDVAGVEERILRWELS